ncbi:MAG: nicotinate-nucleotide adenylyltransferase [Lewinellaceae bacterium]|nr:nicotinate-nucleotide adenylyltransferase [Lewinellaceae bacterium]HPG09253.1 nicotinate (nicotinamide) nucleotide adenylyltransferase [Saprospiraceae bacterium]HPR01108.1 nicotinate (nicotinamide) nucleotide adenylyltransferase [Saprospiraceae bacterium]HQU55702.1 nicotinate (nicotinamide) nucleotide adenylyltransferase [Saprospiraceae bacterium]
MKVGLFFGSFNPVHTGHMIIAHYMAEYTDLEQVWIIVSPQNPFKKKDTLANDYDRLHLVHLAIGDHLHLRASNIEFNLPKPSYTIDTLTYLHEKYPEHEFCLIMGGDNLASLPKWKNYEQILAHHHIYVYSRPNIDPGPLVSHPRVTMAEAPLLDISASFIRQCIRSGKSVQYMVPDAVFAYLKDTNLYRN